MKWQGEGPTKSEEDNTVAVLNESCANSSSQVTSVLVDFTSYSSEETNAEVGKMRLCFVIENGSSQKIGQTWRIIKELGKRQTR